MQSCCICGNVIRDSGTKIIREAPQYVVCKSCVRPLKTLMDPEAASERFENAIGNLKERAMETLGQPEVKALLKQRFQTAREIIAQREAEHLNRLDYAKKILEEYRNNRFLMTTGFEFQGYRILQYHKVVCAEVVLGTGFFSEYLAGLVRYDGGRRAGLFPTENAGSTGRGYGRLGERVRYSWRKRDHRNRFQLRDASPIT